MDEHKPFWAQKGLEQGEILAQELGFDMILTFVCCFVKILGGWDREWSSQSLISTFGVELGL